MEEVTVDHARMRQAILYINNKNYLKLVYTNLYYLKLVNTNLALERHKTEHLLSPMPYTMLTIHTCLHKSVNLTCYT